MLILTKNLQKQFFWGAFKIVIPLYYCFLSNSKEKLRSWNSLWTSCFGIVLKFSWELCTASIEITWKCQKWLLSGVLIYGRSEKFSVVLGKTLLTVSIVSIVQKHSPRLVLMKRYSKNMLQIYRRRPMWNCDFNKLAKQLCWNHTYIWVVSAKFASYFHFQKTFLPKHFWGDSCENFRL